MSSYATIQDFKDQFASDDEVAAITDNTAAEGPNTDVIQDALDRTEGIINSYLAKRYAVPIATSDASVLAALGGCTLDMCVYRVVGGRSDVVSPAKQRLYDYWIEWLKMIAEGKIFLPGATPLPGATAAGYRADWGAGDADVTTEDAVRVFSRASQALL